MSDPRKFRHWAREKPDQDDAVTQVPCFVCEGEAGRICTDCMGTGLVAPEVRQAQREAAGNPESSLQCDRGKA